MATVIRCDTCGARLQEEMVLVRFVAGSMAIAERAEPRFVPSETRRELELCSACQRYLQRCVQFRERDARAAARRR